MLEFKALFRQSFSFMHCDTLFQNSVLKNRFFISTISFFRQHTQKFLTADSSRGSIMSTRRQTQINLDFHSKLFLLSLLLSLSLLLTMSAFINKLTQKGLFFLARQQYFALMLLSLIIKSLGILRASTLLYLILTLTPNVTSFLVKVELQEIAVAERFWQPQ